jgi:hypothetical protein
MSDLNELFKVLAEGKKDYQENNPVGKKVKEVKEHVKEDLSVLFDQLYSLKEELEQNLVEEETKYEQLIIEEVSELIAEETLDETELLVEADPPKINPEVDKYLRGKSFQQPDPDLVSKNIDDIRSKIKFLEQTMGRIAATGPGSGEVNFRWLDDVNRATMTEGNDSWLLEYDAATKKVQFTENVGPIQKLRFNTSHVHDDVRDEGTLCWNNVDKTIDLTQNNVTQQIGQENQVLVRNRTGSTITNGMFVRFAGAEENGVARLLVAPFLGDGTYPNLFGLGVATEDILDGGDGFVTVFGKIRNINTTNTGITSETWQVGDILYASPTTPGKLTRIKPTAPNNVIPVAAVLRVDDELGELFIRPTYEQKRPYGSFADLLDQSALLTNTPYAVKIRRTEIANGFSIADETKVVAAISGLYNYQFSLQLSSSNSSSKEVYIWARKNGQDIPDSSTRITISGNGVYDVAAWNFVISMDANNYFELMWATSDTTAKIDAPPATAFCPAVPSVLLTVTEVAL